ncbi:MAG TPA: peptidylprolyl isomerase, partial [Myxococcota bacterium]|nr:peptidylprolyl isomerase [Myxococcota bacterium]
RGEVVDSNKGSGGKPFSFLHGAGNILPALEQHLLGKAKNDFVEVELAPAEAYGERDPDAVRGVPRSAFPTDREPEVGALVEGRSPDGQPLAGRITAVGAEEVQVDLNHPMAGERLFFEVTVCGVRDATAEETEHGHPHGPDGHHHH